MARFDPAALNASILIVEDVVTVRRLIASLLTTRGFDVSEAGDETEALEELTRRTFDVILLDLELPDGDGLDLCRSLRDSDNGRDPYVVIVSGRDTEADRIRGFDAGADDYVVKPFSPEELVMRVDAMLRRPRHRLHDRSSSGDIELISDSQAASIDGTTVELTKIEYLLLATLLEHTGTVVGRDDLIEACWGPSPTDDHHLLSVHVANLRRKIDPDGILIRTRRGVGYVLVGTVPDLAPALRNGARSGSVSHQMNRRSR